MGFWDYDAGTGRDLPASFDTSVTLDIANIRGYVEVEDYYKEWCEIGATGDADMVKLSLDAGNTYLLAAYGAGYGGTADIDPGFALYDSGGNRLQVVSNTTLGTQTGNDGQADIYFTAGASGTYYMLSWSDAAAGSSQATGVYSVFASQVAAGTGPDATSGTAGDDTLSGSGSGDLILGGGGDDWIEGQAGADVIYGNRAEDILWGQGGADILYGGQDDDQIGGGDGADVVYGNFGVDLVWGNDGDDHVYGGQDNDVLWGHAGNDSLYGNLHDDQLKGGSGADYLDGGGGSDTAVFENASTSYAISRVDADTLVVGEDTLVGIETLSFSDGTLDTDLF